METFKKSDGTIIPNVLDYIRNYIMEHPTVLIFVGCDSKNEVNKTVYATTICFQHPGNGVHVIYRRETVPRIRDLFTRLWKEAENTLSVAEYIRDTCGEKKITLDLDFNSFKIHGSNIAHDAGVGYCVAHGFLVRTKPNAIAATHAADYFCR